MRVCLDRQGSLIEMQSDATAGTLIRNALAAGYREAEIDEREITPEEWATMQERLRPVPTYADLRRAAYPPVGDQLDAIWHAMEAGTLAMVPGFFDAVATVKQQYPKGM